MRHREHILILGAGLQGACAALEAATRGHTVTVIDQALNCLDRASLRNEGKIHLGHVYAHDASFRTAELMLHAALSFAPLLEGWMPGRFDWPALRANPFHYIVARDSLLAPERLFAHYARLDTRYHELLSEDPQRHYLGERPTWLWQPAPLPACLNPASASAAVRTPETSIKLTAFRDIIAASLARHPRIATLYGHHVAEVTRKPHGFTVAGTGPSGAPFQHEAGLLVNALWDGRLGIDAQLGFVPDRPWVYRFKHRVLGRTPPALAGLPSMTFVLGAYGDVVTQPDNDTLYLSWYPVCQTGWSQAIAPPADWNTSASGAASIADQAPIIQQTLAAFDRHIPGLAQTNDTTADGGVIFAWGETDIDQDTSELHQRHRIGIFSADGYYSINTGKLTCAPLFARQLGDLLA